MEADPELESWKRERENVARHLAWLDAEIARRSAREEDLAPSPAAKHLGLPDAAAVHGQEHRQAKSDSTNAPGGSQLSQPRGGVTQSQRLGCIALAAIVAAGVVFLIWILPNWLYD